MTPSGKLKNLCICLVLIPLQQWLNGGRRQHPHKLISHFKDGKETKRQRNIWKGQTNTWILTPGNIAHMYSHFGKFVRTYSNSQVEYSKYISGLPLKDRKRNPSVDTYCQVNGNKTQTWSRSLLEHKTTLLKFTVTTHTLKKVRS